MANGEGTAGSPRPSTGARPPDERAPDSPADAPVPPRADDPPPSVARLAAVAGALVVLAVVLVWLTRSGDDGGFAGSPPGGVTVPTDDEGRPVDLPPSQPATAVLLDASGLLVRPDPVRARIVDPVSGQDVIVPLPPGSTVDTVTGEIVSHTTTTRAGGTPTSRLTTTTASETTTTEETTTTTEETTTTTEETTTTTEETTTTTSDTVVAG